MRNPMLSVESPTLPERDPPDEAPHMPPSEIPRPIQDPDQPSNVPQEAPPVTPNETPTPIEDPDQPSNVPQEAPGDPYPTEDPAR